LLFSFRACRFLFSNLGRRRVVQCFLLVILPCQVLLPQQVFSESGCCFWLRVCRSAMAASKSCCVRLQPLRLLPLATGGMLIKPRRCLFSQSVLTCYNFYSLALVATSLCSDLATAGFSFFISVAGIRCVPLVIDFPFALVFSVPVLAQSCLCTGRSPPLSFHFQDPRLLLSCLDCSCRCRIVLESPD
jgi:hypothetical protein